MNLVETRPLRFGPELGVARHESSFLFIFVRLTSDADGRVSGSVEYDVFGKVVTETGVFVSSSGGMTNLVFGYAGKPYDTVTGLSDYGFRDYAPTLARFTTVDPIRDGSNWYAYCNADPVNYVDAWGLHTCQDVRDFNNQFKGYFNNTNPLSDFIDLDKFAKVICQNVDKLDDKTKAYVKSLGSAAEYVITKYLGDVKVYSGLNDETNANIALAKVGLSQTMGSNGDLQGLTVANSIYMTEALDPTTISPEDIQLLGHEFIHVLQGVAQGYATFLTDYTDTTKYQYNAKNPYELAAYWFGGMLTDDFLKQIGAGNQILTQTSIKR
ncbi:MAG: hypothetical protein K5930_08530 [Treponemataceae bacterium]|nr:hypothetical protein [Treponemataceae bacterium]